MIAAGASAGVAAAFGAPMGGALFCYECAQPNTFWSFIMLWRIFFCTSIASFTLSILNSLYINAPLSFSEAAALKFGLF